MTQSNPPTDEARKMATPLSLDELKSMFATLDTEPDEFATWSTSYAGARRIRATITSLSNSLRILVPTPSRADETVDILKVAIREYSEAPECMKPDSRLARDVVFTHAPGLAIYLLERFDLSRRSAPVREADADGQTHDDYADLGRSFFEAYNDALKNPAMASFICADSPVEIVPHLLNLIADMDAPTPVEDMERAREWLTECSQHLRKTDLDVRMLAALLDTTRQSENARATAAEREYIIRMVGTWGNPLTRLDVGTIQQQIANMAPAATEGTR